MYEFIFMWKSRSRSQNVEFQITENLGFHIFWHNIKMGKWKKERKQLVYALRTTHQLLKSIITWIKIF